MNVRDLVRHLDHLLAGGAPRSLEPAPRVADEAHILELRIHGVSNTPPAALLDVDADDVQNLRGDTLGSFWGLTPTALAQARRYPTTHHRHVPAEVHREAYSWGQMARSSPSAPGTNGNAWGQRLSRAGWMLLVPMGLANAAYWSRRLSKDPKVFSRGARSIRLFGLGLTLLVVTAVQVVSLDLVATQCFAGDSPRCPSLPGALSSLETFTWTQRLAVMSVVPVAVLVLLYWLSAGSRVRYEQPTSDAVAPPPFTQGLPRPGEGRSPAADEWSLGHADLWSRWGLTGAMARLHFAAGMALTVLTMASADLWGASSLCRDLLRSVVDPGCRRFGSMLSEGPSGVLFVVALLLLVAAGYLVWRASYLLLPNHVPAQDTSGRPRVRALQKYATFVFAAAVATFGVEAVLLWGWGRDSTADDARLVLPLSPALLVCLLLATALVGTTWRSHAPAWTGIAWLGAALVGGALVAAAVGRASGPGLSSAAGVRDGVVTPDRIALVGVVVLLASGALWRGEKRSRPADLASGPGPDGRLLRRSDPPVGRRAEGWWGMAPAVFLVLSVGLAVMLTSLLVVAMGDWLNGSLSAQCLDPQLTTQRQEMCRDLDGRAASGGTVSDGTQTGADAEGLGAAAPVALVIPRTYTVFTTTTVFALGAAAVLALLGALWTGCARVYRRRRGLSEDIAEAAAGLPIEALESHRPGDLAVVDPAGTLAVLLERLDLAHARVRTRRLAGIAKRGELFLGCLAVAYACALVVTVWWATLEPPIFEAHEWVDPLTSVGLWSTALLWTAVVVRAVTQTSSDRPLGLVWDLMCFLPRSAHPFGPPCYAERVVPEVAARVARWLDITPRTSDTAPGAPDGAGHSRPGRSPERLVVLSAHSLGAVLAIAAIFTQVPRDIRGRLGLLTYGTQVRPYFGRFFPELLGNQVMGTVACPAPRAVTPDPWPPRDRDPMPAGLATDAAGCTGTLIERLGGTVDRPPAWVSLWRSTDPLGMPVASDAPNLIDRGAQELDTTAYVAAVATHGGYPRVAAYRHAFDEVLDRMTVIRSGPGPSGDPR